MEVDAAWWQREFSYKAEDGKDIIRIVPLWFEDHCEGCSVDDLSSTTDYISNTYDFEDLRLDFAGAKELFEHIYERTKDEALLSIKEKLKEISADESIEAVIPELKRIIDSHDDLLKVPYMRDV